MKLKNKLFFLFLVITVIPLFFIAILVFYNARNYFGDLITRDLSHIADLKAQKVENFFIEIRRDLEVAQDYYNIKENLPVVSAFFNKKTDPQYIASKKRLDGQLKTLQESKGLIDVMLSDASGKIVYHSNDKHEEKFSENFLNDFAPEIFEKSKKGIYFSEPYKKLSDKYEYKVGILAVAPIYGFDGKFIGEVAFEIGMNLIYELIRVSGDFGETEEILIAKKINDTEVLILNNLRYEKDAALNKKIAIGDKFGFPIQQAALGNNGFGLTTDYRGVEVLANWRYLSDLGWGMVTKIDASEAFAPVNNLKNIIILVGFAEFLAILSVIFAASKLISDPIEKLRKGVGIISSGNLSYKIGTTAKDEVGVLSRAFEEILGQLNESHKRYIDLIESTPVCVKVFDASGKLIFINKGGREEHLLSDDYDISKWDWISTIENPYKKIVKEKFEKALKGEKSVVEFEHKTDKARNRWDSSVLSPIKDKNGKVVSVIVHSLDITKLKDIESNLGEKVEERTHDLLESEKRYRTLVDLSPDAFIVHSGEKVIFVNDAAVKLLGANSPDKIIGKSTMNFVHPDSADVVKNRIKEMLTKGKGVPMIYEKFLRLDGSAVDVEVVAIPIMFQGKKSIQVIARDVSNHKKVEDLLRRSYIDLEKFRLAVESASDHIILTDPEGVIIYVNKAAEKLTGYSFDEMVGNKPSLWGKQMPMEFYRNMWNVIKKDKKTFAGEMTNKRKTGQLYEVELHISPVFDEVGNIQYFVGIEKDITAIKNIERTRREFISIASHQLQTPLTAIKWVIERFLKDKTLNEKNRGYMDDIYLSTRRLSSIVNDLLNVSRIESGAAISVNPVKMDMIGFLNESMKEWSPLFDKKQIKNSFVKDIESLDVETDKGIMGNIFQCLVSNAIEYTANNGNIIILIKKLDDDKFLFSVKDTGIGIPKADKEKMFMKFSRADNAKLVKPSGTGIGLYVAKELVKLLGGKIWFESEENVGTTFFVELPMKSKEIKGEKKII